MRAAIFYEPGDVRMEDVGVPDPGPGEVLVRMGAALACGTDLKTFKRGHPTLIKELPSPFGHEFGGTIEKVGEGVRPLDDVVAALRQHGRQEGIKYEIRPSGEESS